MRTATAYEHSRINAARTDEEVDKFDTLEDLFIQRRNEIVLAKTRRMQLRTFDDVADAEMQQADRRQLLSNQLAAALTRRADIEIQIINAMRVAVEGE